MIFVEFEAADCTFLCINFFSLFYSIMHIHTYTHSLVFIVVACVSLWGFLTCLIFVYSFLFDYSSFASILRASHQPIFIVFDKCDLHSFRLWIARTIIIHLHRLISINKYFSSMLLTLIKPHELGVYR